MEKGIAHGWGQVGVLSLIIIVCAWLAGQLLSDTRDDVKRLAEKTDQQETRILALENSTQEVIAMYKLFNTQLSQLQADNREISTILNDVRFIVAAMKGHVETLEIVPEEE
jgi:flavoprotein